MKTLLDVSRFFHPVLPSGALRKRPRRVEIAGRAYALFRDASGRPAALADACAHRLAPLSMGRVLPDGRLACAYHGWRFDRDGHGGSPNQPQLSRCDVRAFQVVERHGYLWLAGPQVPEAALPELGWEGFTLRGAFSSLFQAPLHVVLDNFSEDEHFPFVHSWLGWDEGGARDVQFRAECFDDHTEVHYEGPQRDGLWLRVMGLKPGDRFHNDWVHHFDPVRAIFTFRWVDPRTGQDRPLVFRSAVFFVPETASTTRVHVFMFVKAAGLVRATLEPVIAKVALAVGYLDVLNDARFVRRLADTPESLEGMRLDMFDKPLIRNRRLLRTVYFGQPDVKLASADA